MPVRFTFVVATVDRDTQLRKCVDSIEKAYSLSKNIPIEILIIVQKNKSSEGVLNYSGNSKIFYIDKIGLSVARNYAIERSSGDYLVFIDDDAFVKEDFIERLERLVVKHQNINAFCGRIMDHDCKSPFSRLFINENEKYLSRFDYQYFMGSAHILSRKVINKIGKYDENFGVGARFFGSEETDMFFRLKSAGERVLYSPEIVFFHPVPAANSSYMGKYAYALSAAATKNLILDKKNFFVYFFIIFERIVKSFIRLLQKNIFKGKYLEKDKQYHYAAVIRGSVNGIKGYLRLNYD